jgi:hypothetical protein
MRIRTRRKINKLITIRVSSILNTPPLNSLSPEAKLIQVTSTATKHANKSFLSRLSDFFPCFSLWVEGWLWVGWVVSFGGYDCCFLFVVGGTRNKFGITLLTLILTPLKPNPQSVYGFGCTLLNPTQILLNYLLTQYGFLKTCSQIGNLLLKLGVLFGSIEKLTLERDTCFTRRGQNSVARREIKFVLKILNLNGSSLQIRSKHRTSSTSTQKCGTSLELSEFQLGTVKQTSNMRVNEPQIHIVNHDHSTSVTWLGTHIIVRGSKRSNLRKRTLKLKIQLFVLAKNLTKQLVLVAKSIFKFGNSQRKTIGG